jgi:ketosteroid isomerase-like protein
MLITSIHLVLEREEKMKRLFLPLVLTLLALTFCSPIQSDPAVDKAEIKKVIDNSIGWALTKDKDRLYDSVAQDSTFFIFHPDSASTITGFESFCELVENFFMNENFRATGYKIKDLHIDLSHSGQTAWFRALLDDFGEWRGRPTVWHNVRWTGVLEKNAGKWHIVQMHFSHAK